MFLRDTPGRTAIHNEDFCSVGIVSFNRHDRLKRLIDSIHKHADMPFELVISDDGGNLYNDFNFINDTVRGFLAVAESKRTVGEVINIGSGFEISIGDTVGLIADIMGCDLEIETEEERIRPENSEVERLCADNTKALKLTGWAPEYNGAEGLRAGLEKTVEWFSKPENLKHYKCDIYNV